MNANQVIEIIENAISAECDGEALYGNFHDVAKRIFLDLLNKGFLTEGNEIGLCYVDKIDPFLGEIYWNLNGSPRALEWQQIYEYIYGTPARLIYQ